MLLRVITLPEPLMRHYFWFTRELEPQWRAFDRSTSSWTTKWAVMLAVYGFEAGASPPYRVSQGLWPEP